MWGGCADWPGGGPTSGVGLFVGTRHAGGTVLTPRPPGRGRPRGPYRAVGPCSVPPGAALRRYLPRRLRKRAGFLGSSGFFEPGGRGSNPSRRASTSRGSACLRARIIGFCIADTLWVPKGCLGGSPFDGAPAVDRTQPLDLLGLEPGPRVEERVVVADHHVARRVPELRRDELRVAAEDQRARNVAARGEALRFDRSGSTTSRSRWSCRPPSPRPSRREAALDPRSAAAQSRSAAEWRSRTCWSSGPNTRFTFEPRVTAGRARKSFAQRTTFV